MRSLVPLALALLGACGSRPKAQGCSVNADCAVADQCSAGICVPLTCGTGLTPCTGACVDLATAGAHCGVCGHDCGGGACGAGQCQPIVVRDGLSFPVFDIDDANLYFHSGDKILSCPLDGCGALAPRQIGAISAAIYGGDLNGGFLLVGGGNLFFMAEATSGSSGPWLHACPLQTGCSTPPEIVARGALQGFSGGFAISGGDFYWGHYKDVHHAAPFNPPETLYSTAVAAPSVMAADAASVYFPDPVTPTSLLRCPRTGTCVPDVVAQNLATPTRLAVRGGRVYLLASGRDGFGDGTLRTCPAGAPGCAPANFAGPLPFPLSLAVDDVSVSWLNRDGVLGGPPYTIVTCPVTGCAGGPRGLASNQLGAYGLRSSARFVYWATPTQILRVAK